MSLEWRSVYEFVCLLCRLDGWKYIVVIAVPTIHSLEHQIGGALIAEQHRRRREALVHAAQFGAQHRVVRDAAAAASRVRDRCAGAGDGREAQRAADAAPAVEGADGHQTVHLQFDALPGRRPQRVAAQRRPGDGRRLDLAVRQAGAVLQGARVQRHVAHCAREHAADVCGMGTKRTGGWIGRV